MAYKGVYSPHPPGNDLPGVISSSRSNFDEAYRILNQFGYEIDKIQNALSKIEQSKILYWISHASVVNKRIVSTDSPYTVQPGDVVLFVDTDGGAVTINMPKGVSGRYIKTVNCGASGRNVTVAPNGTDKIYGTNANYTILDGEVNDWHYNVTEGWW